MPSISWPGAAAWYDRNAAAFAAAADAIDTALLRDAFTAPIPRGGRILDIGCGSGRDLDAFLRAGFDATGLDPSAEMRRISRARLALRGYTPSRVRDGAFETLSADLRQDGIWCLASLLHVPVHAWQDTLRRLHACLSPGAPLLVSVKSGRGESTDASGRPMAAVDPARLATMAGAAAPDLHISLQPTSSGTPLPPGTAVIWTDTSKDSRGADVEWITLLARRHIE